MRILIASETLKLRTVRSPWLLLLAAQAIVAVGVIGAVASGSDLQSTSMLTKAAAHVGLVSMVSLVLGVLAVAGEYRHRTIADTYLTTPGREPVLRAKVAVYAVLGLLVGITASVTALITMAIAWRVKGASLPLSSPDLWQTLGGDVIWNVSFAVIGVALGAIVRNLTAAVAAALLWIALVEGLIGQLIGGLSRWLPVASGAALGRAPGISSATPLPAWAAGLVLAAYAGALTLAAVGAGVRRDVS